MQNDNIFNLAIATDSYKIGHYLQYPKDTQKLFFYMEPRIDNKLIVPFGFQYYLTKYLKNIPTIEQINEAKEIAHNHGFENVYNYEGWKAINKLGYLPLEIRAIPEGTVMNSHNVIMTWFNTLPEFYWLCGWLETLFEHVWYPVTVATKVFHIKKEMRKYVEKTGDLNNLEYMLHDFGYRGVTVFEQAVIGSMAHLTCFNGTDTIAGIQGIKKYYDIQGYFDISMIKSINAMEHSTVTSWGKQNEKQAYENMIDNFAPNGILAMVLDSYDIDNAIDNILGKQLKQKIIDSGATIVCRPDSGPPDEMTLHVMKKLANIFGYTKNDKGYNVLNHVKVIQGDGISNENVIIDIIKTITNEKFSTDNVAFGMGGGLLQRCNRDNLKFAIKCSARVDNVGKVHEVFKCPKTARWKSSKGGWLDLIYDGKEYKTVKDTECKESVLQDIYFNGNIHLEDFTRIRDRINSTLLFDI